MKKFSLLLCCFVVLLVSQKVWAADFEDTQSGLKVKVAGSTLAIESTTGGLLNNYMSSVGETGHVSSENKGNMQACTTIVLDGVFNPDDLNSISTNSGFNSVTLTVLVSGTTLTVTSSTADLLNTYLQDVGTTDHVSSDFLAKMKNCTKIVFDGKFSSADLSAVSNGSGFTGVSTVDMAEARIVSTNSWGNNTNLKFHTAIVR